MIPYIIFAILILISYNKKSYELMVVLLIVFACLRFDTGWDYDSYYRMIDDPGKMDEALTRYSFLWTGFFSLMQSINAPHLAIIIPNFITYLAVFYSVRVFCDAKRDEICDSLFVYTFFPFFYLTTFSEIRQRLALAVIMLTCASLKSNKFVRAIVFAILSFFIHPSSIVCLLLFPAFICKGDIKFWQSVIVSAGFAFGLTGIAYLIEAINIDAITAYASYLDETDLFGSKLVILNALIVVYLFLFCRGCQGKYKTFGSIALFAYICDIIVFVFGISSVVSRVFVYFEIWLIFILLLPRNVSPSLHIGDKIIILPSVRVIVKLSLVLLFFFYLVTTKDGSQVASSGYVPYKFIFFQ